MGYAIGGAVIAAGVLAYGVWRARRARFFQEPDFDVTEPEKREDDCA